MFTDLAATYAGVGAARDWFAEGAIEGMPIVTLAAGEKIGKSWMLIDLAVATVLGTKWLGAFAVRRTGSPIYVDTEYGPHEFTRRVARVSRAHGADPREVLPRIRHLWAPDFRLDSAAQSAQQLFVEMKATKPSLLILDPWRNVMGGDENSATDTIAAMAVVARYREAGGSVVTIAHHLNRGGTMSGSRALKGRSDLFIEGSDAETPSYRAIGRTLRRKDAIAKGFSVKIDHDDDEDDTIAKTRLACRFDGDDSPAPNQQLSVPARRALEAGFMVGQSVTHRVTRGTWVISLRNDPDQ
jgi:hypothetical protein